MTVGAVQLDTVWDFVFQETVCWVAYNIIYKARILLLGFRYSRLVPLSVRQLSSPSYTAPLPPSLTFLDKIPFS